MIETREGDLLEADVDALVNTVNCVGVMGKGLALQFKRRFPANFASYEMACREGHVRLGEVFVVPNSELSGPRWIINFPTKGHWRAMSRLQDIEKGLDNLLEAVHKHGITSIAVPPLGAGNGGLDWRDVEAVIRRKLADHPDLDVKLYPPTTTHRAIMPARVHMTWGRSVLIRLLSAYLERRRATDPWVGNPGASALEIQKLMYFANVREPSLRLRFTQGRYGPYCDQVRHVLQEMEGSFTEGYGDGNDPVLRLQPIVPTSVGLERAARSRAAQIDRDVVEPVLGDIAGFEGAYGLELLGSVHWVMSSEDASEPARVTALVQAWSERKGRLFTEAHVAAAIQRLRTVGLAGLT